MNSHDIAQQVVASLLLALRDNPLPLSLPELPREGHRPALPAPVYQSSGSRQPILAEENLNDDEEGIEEEIQSQMSIELQNYSRYGSSGSGPEIKASNMANLHSIFKEPSRFGRFVASYGRAWGAFELSIQLPGWISSTVCEMKSIPGYSGWTFAFKTWNIVPSTSAVFQRAIAGDADGLKHLFQNGKASPYDRDEQGYSLLQVRRQT